MPLCERLDAEEASPKKEARAVEAATVTPAYVLEREAQLARHRERDEEEDGGPRPPVLRMRRDLRTGRWRLWADLDDAEGAAINQALRRRAAQFGPDPETGTYAPIATRMAMALHEVCASAIAADPDPDRATVVVFMKGPVAELAFGPTVSDDTSDRLFCDAASRSCGSTTTVSPTASRTSPSRCRGRCAASCTTATAAAAGPGAGAPTRCCTCITSSSAPAAAPP
jgi:hypothetical protein